MWLLSYLCCYEYKSSFLFFSEIHCCKGAFGRVRSIVYRGYFLDKYLPKYCSVRPQRPTGHSGKVRYQLYTGSRHFGKFGMTSTYRYSTGHFDKFGTSSRSVLDTYIGKDIPGVFSPPITFDTPSIPYRALRYGSVRTRYQKYPRYRYTIPSIPFETCTAVYDVERQTKIDKLRGVHSHSYFCFFVSW